MLFDFQFFFTAGLNSKFETRLMSHFTPHLTCNALLHYVVKNVTSKIAKFWRIQHNITVLPYCWEN